jgi:hypothetical protein
MQTAVFDQAFDGRDPCVVALGGEHQARELRLAVRENRAGAAFPELAPVFRAV